jgi:hypothetical protein
MKTTTFCKKHNAVPVTDFISFVTLSGTFVTFFVAGNTVILFSFFKI